MNRNLFIEYMPTTYPENPYRIVQYNGPNDNIGTDLGGGRDFEEALIIMRKIMITYDHMSPSRVDAELTAIYGKTYEKALKRWKAKVLGEQE